MTIVAIGASAGGLEALSHLLDGLSPTTGMAFIIVQHLDPAHPSLLAELLAEHSKMTVAEAVDGASLAPDHIYVIPPGRYLSVSAGALKLSSPQARHGARLPIDFLFDSLAADCGARTIGVILSGTGSDGSSGLAAIKAAGGLTIAQMPGEAEYEGMPASAIATGMVDEILNLKDIPAALERHGEATEPADGAPAAVAAEGPVTDLGEIIAFLNETTAQDFRQYKPGTLERRIERRMTLLGIKRGDLTAYLDLLRKDAGERGLLAKDLLIHVTSFFRDPGIFEALAADVLPGILKRLPDGQALRIWVAGCSTGEEAYSIAMISRDAIAACGRDIRLQLFASDVDPEAIAFAREGLFTVEACVGMAPDLVARYFVKEEAGYRITAALRGDVVFTVQDVLADPPFSKIDLVSCRNLLIYLNPEAQAKVITFFHFALREGGILVLGSSETVSSASSGFEVIAKAERFYRRIAETQHSLPAFPLMHVRAMPKGVADDGTSLVRQATLAAICRHAVLARHAPAAVLINRQRQCLFSMGPTETFLRVAPGYATLDLLAMATPALRSKLRAAINKASKSDPFIHVGRTRVTVDGKTLWFGVDIEFLAGDSEDLLLVCFVKSDGAGAGPASARKGADAARIAELEQELQETQAELRLTIDNQETSSQEQKALNEEALSVNEEFQSTNEELLTSKEELQSLNEELTALNGQLQETLERQRLTSDDLQNVLYSTNVGTLFLDLDLKIRFFTPAIRALFHIIPGDIGRLLADLRPLVADAELLTDAQTVLAEKLIIEREIAASGTTWFLRRIFPYVAHDNRVEGVVITFADISERKSNAKALETSKQEAERANLAKSRFLAAASHDLRQPLQSLTLIKELLVQSVEGERPRDLLGRLGTTLDSMSGMLNALLDINQIEAGVVEARPSVFPISDILDRLRDEFSDLAESRNLALHVMPSAALVESDPDLLEQMARNLLGNAIKYTKTGKILLGCRRRGDTLRIEVWDSGIGIASDQLDAIFDEFHQVGNDARDRNLGLGLGLSIVQRLAHLLGHAVDVRSIPGKGSIFSIMVPSPRAKPVAELTDRTEPALPSGTAMPHGKIVVIDDDPDVLEFLEQLLRANGYIARAAPDGAAALKLIAGGAIKPELLLTDYNLPNGMDGLALIGEVRSLLQQTLPAIVLTGDISRDTLKKIAAEDCVQLSKPVKPDELMRAIETLCLASAAPHMRDGEALVAEVESIAYVVDDDPEIRSTIRAVLEDDGRIVEDYASAELFLAAYRPGTGGCLLVDAFLPGLNGVALLDTLRARGDRLPTILITGSSDVGLAVEAMRNGACDFIEKPVGRVELLASIKRAIEQSHEIRLVDALHEKAATNVASLTNRQREIMEMVLAGHPSKNIAADLSISQRTVENHRAAIMTKMGTRSLPELARMAQAAVLRHDAGASPELPVLPDGAPLAA